MFKLEILEKYWLPGQPEETDLCLHGTVRVQIGDDVLEDEVCLSAAALHLLRSVTEEHQPDELAKLFPIDGFCWTPDGEGSIYLGGCPNGGFDGYVTHEDDVVRIALEGLPAVRIPLAEYQAKVFAFADQVEAFFRQSKPKFVNDELDKLWYPLFWEEWRLRRAAAENP